MAPPKKPSNIKAISGTLRKDRDHPVNPANPTGDPVIDMELVDVASPPPPSWLPNSHAVKEWRRLAPILVQNKLLTKGGLSAFGMLCALHGKIVQLYAAGEAPPASMMGTYRSLINDFGLTPAAQGKVKSIGNPEAPIVPEKPHNAFSNNGRRPQEAA